MPHLLDFFHQRLRGKVVGLVDRASQLSEELHCCRENLCRGRFRRRRYRQDAAHQPIEKRDTFQSSSDRRLTFCIKLTLLVNEGCGVRQSQLATSDLFHQF